MPHRNVEETSTICAARIPRNHAVLFFYPGYSTSCRHGGLHPAWDGGVLRTLLSYLANSRYVAYLDDDNWWDGSHLESMRLALEGCEWAYARRWFIHPKSRRPICPDEWESIGPNRGTICRYRRVGRPELPCYRQARLRGSAAVVEHTFKEHAPRNGRRPKRVPIA